MRDERIIQVRKIVTSILSITDFPFCNILVTENNTLIMIVRDTVIYTVQLLNVQPGFPISFNYNNIISLEEDEYIQDEILCIRLRQIWNNYSNIETHNNLLAYEKNLNENDEFNKLSSMKAKDGMKYFKIYGNIIDDVYFIPIFNKFPNLNKNDTIDIYVYQSGIEHFVIVMDIFKKKINRNIKMYFKTINLNQKY